MPVPRHINDRMYHSYGERDSEFTKQFVSLVEAAADLILPVDVDGSILDTGSSSTTALGISEEATGPWIDTSTISSLLAFAYGLVALDTFELQWSSDGVNPDTDLLAVTDLTTNETVTSGFFIYLPSSVTTTMIRRYVRLHVINGPDAQTSGFYTHALWRYHSSSYPWTMQSLNAQLSNLSTALLTRAVQAGVQPDGDFVNIKADGVALAEATPLGGDGVFTSGWVDTDGWASAEIFVRADAASAAEGIHIDFTDNVQAQGDFTADDTTDLLTVVDHELEAGDAVWLTSTVALPSPLVASTDYFVRDVSGDTFKLATEPGGAAIDITDTGTGTHSLAPPERGARTYTFGADDVTAGFAAFRFPTELDGLRVIYTNGSTGQNTFLLVTTLRTSLVSPQASYNQQITSSNIALMTRSGLVAPNDADEWDNIHRSDNGGLRQSIVEHEVETPVKSLPTWRARVVNVPSSGSVRLDQLTGRRTIVIKHNDAADQVWLKEDSSAASGVGFALSAQESIGKELTDDAQVWARADASVTEFDTTRSGTTVTNNGGSNPNNVLASDDARGTLSAVAQSFEVDGFTALQSGAEVSQVLLGFEVRKASTPTTETVAHVQTVEQGGNGGTSITSPSIAAGNLLSFVAWVANGATTPRAVNTVTGGGLTWVKIAEILNSSGDGALSMWRAVGSPSSAFTVTANFAGVVADKGIVVTVHSGVDQTDPIQASVMAEAAGSGANAWSLSSIAGTSTTGRFLVGVNGINRDPSAINPTIQRADIAQGNVNLEAWGGAAGATNVASGAHSAGNPDWIAGAVTLRPAATTAPIVRLYYEVSGVEGSTSELHTIDVTSDTAYETDITGDEAWAFTTNPGFVGVDAIHVFAEVSTIGAAPVEIDHIYLHIIESAEGGTKQVCVAEYGI